MSGTQSLIQQLSSAQTIERAWKVVRKNRKVAPGIDGVTIELFESTKRQELPLITEQLRNGSFDFQPAKRAHIRKNESETRPINVLTIRDKIVQQAIQTIFLPKRDREKTLFPEIYNSVAVAYLPGKNGLKESVEKIKQAYSEGYKFLVTMDIKSFFDEIPSEEMYKKIVTRLGTDTSINWLIKKTIEQEVHKKGVPELNPGGVLQGSILAPLYSNIYLAEFDKKLLESDLIAIRYADDIAILTRTHKSAVKAVEIARKSLKETAKMDFYPDGDKKGPQIQHLDDHGVFLGIRYSRNPHDRLRIEPSKKKISTQKGKVDEFFLEEDTSIAEAIIRTNQSIHSWFHHYDICGCHMGPLRKALREIHLHYLETIQFVLKKEDILLNPNLTRKQMYKLGVLNPSTLKRKRKRKKKNG